MLVKPSEAAMIVAVVEAMPFWVKVALYGARLAGQVVEQVLADGRPPGRRRVIGRRGR